MEQLVFTDTGSKMSFPNVTIHDISTGFYETREMTEEEYSALLESGWTPEANTEE